MRRKEDNRRVSVAADPDATVSSDSSVAPNVFASVFGDTATTAADASLAAPVGNIPAHRDFQIKGELGRGGMGLVYLAREACPTRDVALKSVNQHAAAQPESLQRFLREAYITAQLQHPGIVPVYRVDRGTAGLPYYTMRPIEGRPLNSIIEALRKEDAATLEQFPLRRLVRIFHSVCQTIRFAHDRGVIHRDLKPANIVVGEYGEVVVLDWGLAKTIKGGDTPTPMPANSPLSPKEDVWSQYQRRVDPADLASDSDLLVTLEGKSMGTPAYMSPEQALGRVDQVGMQSDVWALGVILYELCALRRPFEARETREMVRLITSTDPMPPGKVAPKRKIPPELAEIAMRCLRRDQAQRYATTGILADAIDKWLEGVAPWRLVADVDFSKLPDGPPPGWTNIQTKNTSMWEVRSGLLGVAKNDESVLLLDAPAGGDVRVEMEAMVIAGQEGDISPILSAPPPGTGKYYDGYFLQFGADAATRSKLSKNSMDVASIEETRQPDRWYNVTAERVGDVLRLTVDGNELLSWRDQVPLSGDRVGLYTWGCGLRVRRFRAFARGVSVTVSCLDIPNAFYNEGLIDKAKAQYLRVAESHPARDEGMEALFLAGKCCVDLAGKKGVTGERVSALLEEASGYFDRLERTALAPMGCLGKSMVHKFRGQSEEEAGELCRAYGDYPGHDALPIIGQRLWERAFELKRESYDREMKLFALPAARFHPQGLLSTTSIPLLSEIRGVPEVGDLLLGILQRVPLNRWLCACALEYRAVWLGQNDLHLVMRQCEELLRSYPDQRGPCAKSLEWMALMHADLRDFDTAEVFCQRVLTEYPEQRQFCSLALMAWSLVAADRGEMSRGLDLLDRLLNEYSEYRTTCASALGNWAWLHAGRDDYDRADTLFDRICTEFSDIPEPASDGLLGKAYMQIQRGKDTEALGILQHIVNAYPKLWRHRSEALTGAAYIWCRRGQRDETLSTCHSAFAICRRSLGSFSYKSLFGKPGPYSLALLYATCECRDGLLRLLSEWAEARPDMHLRAFLASEDPIAAVSSADDTSLIRLADALLLSLVLFARGDDRGAATNLKRYLALAPDAYPLWAPRQDRQLAQRLLEVLNYKPADGG